MKTETSPLTRTSSVVDVASEAFWSDPVCHRHFLDGLQQDGWPSEVISFLSDVLGSGEVKSFDDFKDQALGASRSWDSSRQAALLQLLEQHEKVRQLNATVYDRATPEKTRVSCWPNNPDIRTATPDHYFDIYTDFPYRTGYRFITKETPIGSAGSCFAMRIAHQLQDWGYNYVIEEDDLPPGFPLDRLSGSTYRMAPARVGTLFDLPSMRQMVERAFGEWTPQKLVVKDAKGRWVDPYRTIKSLYQTADEYETDFKNHTMALRRALSRCQVFILTLGLTEAWQLASSGDFISLPHWRIDPSLLRRKHLSFEENLEALERLYAVYRKHKPGIKMIISLSPVPFRKTFSQEHHVLEANAISKATLRLVADAFVRNHPKDAFYLPSYEIVTYGTRSPWASDKRHVSQEGVDRVMRLFQKMFLVDQEALPLLSVKDTFKRRSRLVYLLKKAIRK